MNIPIKNNFLLIRMSFNHGKMLVWNVSIWVRGSCRYTNDDYLTTAWRLTDDYVLVTRGISIGWGYLYLWPTNSLKSFFKTPIILKGILKLKKMSTLFIHCSCFANYVRSLNEIRNFATWCFFIKDAFKQYLR